MRWRWPVRPSRSPRWSMRCRIGKRASGHSRNTRRIARRKSPTSGGCRAGITKRCALPITSLPAPSISARWRHDCPREARPSIPVTHLTMRDNVQAEPSLETASQNAGETELMSTFPSKPANVISRRAALQSSAFAASGLIAGSWLGPARSAPVNIRYATGGGIGPNEMETLIWLDYLKSNVLKHYGKTYTLEMTFTRGSPEAAQLLAAGQVDLAALSSPAFAAAMAKDAVPDGISIISDNYQDGHPGFATNTFLVMKDSPIKTVADLKGKKVDI